MFNWFKNKIEVTGQWMDWWEIVNIIRPYTTDPTPHKMLKYLLPADESIMRLLKKFRVTRDVPCHAAVDIFKGRMAEAGLYDVFAPSVRIKKPTWTKTHECVGFIVDQKIVFGEPQTGEYPVYEGANIEWVEL